ncbi:xanthine dehydrogenase family protein molybdopterin-binding subunit [Paraburkholderia caballeronis]|uniref:CO or xanthine dehydrogenase, Mo-binding subunit n=1 Tax=Paraburkholderia caballeronis TaxID=416943 RepID=A0A1H7L6C9_9BURK|nr:molybdopterin cofactor-binding domain-containing protein [Paraburkholderia caballeronis]PXW28308.1 CO/xanthine dehydrogenase Mo-binding subunit [Paraburkholderia caballeronis]PXX03674.1 CO/xanthine dehydrogenase Mo-binding subunit [Paraburkholderia caballeronis]RAK04418.1 CO/xanthine dehydrogenase Mo-binding subunit [Paraburkholderia caballeronis]SED80985.1 CO or xanthine dehydrogenase, Mo-binding subunit [Paraburkholderia caballeronis]SEK94370.1 CO or xanthine dehydrogenase, Mo-binding sub
MKRPDEIIDESRRHFIVSGALFVGFTLAAPRHARADEVIADEGAAIHVSQATEALAGSLKTNPLLDAWIRISPDGKVTVFTGKVELGTGVRTALLQVAAEELNMAPSLITFLTADTGASPDEGLTAGSHTIADSGTALLNAAAQVRGLLVSAAAGRFGVPAKSLVASDALILAPDGRSISYGDAVGLVDLHRNASATSPLKDPATFQVIGTSLPRVDIPSKVTGGISYVQDMQLPGMLHARIVMPPSYGATLVEVDEAAVTKLPGVVRIVRNGSLLAVVATGEWQAVVAQRALSNHSRWRAGRALPDPATVHRELKTLATQRIEIAAQHDAVAPATRTLSATYIKRYLLHGSIGPSCSVARFDDGTLTVWTHSQGVYPLRDALAEMLSMPKNKVRCIHTEGSGCYGHNGADDVAAHAALIACAMPGHPVRVQWMREQEHTWDHFTPAMVTEVHASLDATGHIVDWEYALWSSSHNERIVNAGRLTPATMLEKPFAPAPSVPMLQPEGGGDRNAIPLYTLPNMRVTNYFSPTMPLPTSAMRSLGAHTNIFSIESFVDELAHAAGIDPVQFRLMHMQDPRARDVIELAAKQFGWPRRDRTPGRGVGFAFGKYKNLMAYVAIAVEISVVRETGHVRLENAHVAVDAGQIVSPDGIRNQIQGGVVQSTSWTLYESLQYDTQRIRSFDWSSYPIMRFQSVPDSVDVHLIDRPGAPFLGAAEASMGPTAGALANALFDATSVRVREMPLAGDALRRLIDV